MNEPWAGARTVARLLELRAAESPTGVAFWQESADRSWQPIAWQGFAGQVATLRRALYAAGLRKGERLALIAPVSLEWELLHHAALAMGAVVVGMDAHDLPGRIATMAEQADIAAFATTDLRALSAVNAGRLGGARFLLDLGGAGDPPAGVRGLSWPELNALGDVMDAAPGPPNAEDLATIIFTSGTTGAPKGIAYSHGQVCLAIDAICDAFSFVGRGSTLLCWLPLSNLFQRMVNLAGMRQGAATYLLADPRRVMAVVAAGSPDIFVGVPRFYEKLYDGIRDNIATQSPLRRRLIELAWGLGRRVSQARLQSRTVSPWLERAHWAADHLILRRVRQVMGKRLLCMITGSAPTPRYLLEELHALGWLVLEAYGLSENVMPMAMNRKDDFRFGTVGRPLRGNQIVVGNDGAIRVRGPGMFGGYLGEAPRAPFDADGFYLTGDYGQFDADGYLRLTGRTGEMIKTSTGWRVQPASVEARLRSVPGIDQAMVVGAGRKCLVALCTSAAGRLDASARSRLEAALLGQVARLTEHERPSAIALIERPFSIEDGELTPNLKLRRAAIEERYAGLIQKLYELTDRSADSTAHELVVI